MVLLTGCAFPPSVLIQTGVKGCAFPRLVLIQTGDKELIGFLFLNLLSLSFVKKKNLNEF